MGGSAFASGENPLSTPRMPTHVYQLVRPKCHDILSRYFEHVATPIEAPGKKDYGDVDFLVACPRSICMSSDIAETLGTAFGAERTIAGKGSQTVNFAIPWPHEELLDGLYGQGGVYRGKKDVFVQVDVNMCGSKERWEWELFHHAHGDLWNILGSTIRKYGLTVNDKGLYVRIEEIELIDRKKSMIRLTSKPSEVLGFLGLDEARWWKPFGSAQEMYEYAAGCRFFWANDARKQIDEDKRELKHNDRQRMKQRPIFKQWVEEFVPQCRANGTHSKPPPTREQTLDDIFERFAEKNKYWYNVKEEYERRLTEWRRERQIDEIWRKVIKEGVPTENVSPELRGAAIRGLKAIILESKVWAGIYAPESLKREDGFYDIEEVVKFVRNNWRVVGNVEMESLHERMVKKMKQKQLDKEEKMKEKQVDKEDKTS
jgi:hypothetical protein